MIPESCCRFMLSVSAIWGFVLSVCSVAELLSVSASAQHMLLEGADHIRGRLLVQSWYKPLVF